MVRWEELNGNELNLMMMFMGVMGGFFSVWGGFGWILNWGVFVLYCIVL